MKMILVAILAIAMLVISVAALFTRIEAGELIDEQL